MTVISFFIGLSFGCPTNNSARKEPFLHLAAAANGPFLFREKGTPDEYKAGLDLAIERGWLAWHQSGSFVRFTQSGADLFA